MIFALAWLAYAVTLAATGVLAHALWLIPLSFAAAVGGTLVAWRRSSRFRAWTAALDLRVPILLHVTRIAFGALFLFELAAGHLPAVFAERAGYGDILAGALAIVAAIAAGRYGPMTSTRRAVVLAFSVIGLADIIMVFVTAQVAVLVDHDARMVAAIGTLPYALLPTVVVPLVILTHLLVFQRLIRGPQIAR